MGKMLIVAKQEYLNRVRNRGFVIGMILFPILIAALMFLPALLMNVDVEQAATYQVIDQTGQLFDDLVEALPDTNEVGERLYDLEDYLASSGAAHGDSGSRTNGSGAGTVDIDAIVAELTPAVEEGEIGGFFVIPEDYIDGGSAASFYARNVSDDMRNRRFRRILDQAARQVRISRSDLSTEQIAELMVPTQFSTFRVRSGEAEEDEGQTFILAYVFSMIFYMMLIYNGIAAMRAVLEEKTARTAELMISSVRPTHLLGGKLIAIVGAALTQLAVWFISGILLVQQGKSLPGQISDITQLIEAVSVPPMVFVIFFVFFVLGFLFYSGLFVSVGAMVNSETEAQNLQTPVMMPIIAAFLMMFLAIRSPDGMVTTILSMIPLFSPILMTVRACVVMPPMWQVALSAAILFVGVMGSIWISARVFRVGLLMHGKKPSLPELMRWIRYA